MNPGPREIATRAVLRIDFTLLMPICLCKNPWLVKLRGRFAFDYSPPDVRRSTDPSHPRQSRFHTFIPILKPDGL